MNWRASIPCLAAALLAGTASPARAADPAVTACGEAYLRMEGTFARRSLRLAWLLCQSPDRVDVQAAPVIRATNQQIAAFNAHYTAQQCDPDLSLPVAAKTVADVRHLLEGQLRSVPLDRFCNGASDPLPLCGNGQEDLGEVCDGADLGDQTCQSLGNGTGTLACSSDCQGFVFTGCSGPPFCGNLVREQNEACDTGGSTATCDYDCTAPVCGDGRVNAAAGEQCDNGMVGTITAGCNHLCRVPVCGNGIVETAAGESCDTAGPSAGCNINCRNSICGDGILNTLAGEVCEDGNNQNGDGCSAACQFE